MPTAVLVESIQSELTSDKRHRLLNQRNRSRQIKFDDHADLDLDRQIACNFFFSFELILFILVVLDPWRPTPVEIETNIRLLLVL